MNMLFEINFQIVCVHTRIHISLWMESWLALFHFFVGKIPIPPLDQILDPPPSKESLALTRLSVATKF